jgi:SAM-dependent methyltransferase
VGFSRRARCAEFVSQNIFPAKALIPGCGTGYEVRAFHQAGWKVTAIDFSPVAVEQA